MNFEGFITEKVLKRDDRQEITIIYNPNSGKRFIKRVISDDKRYIYKRLQKISHKRGCGHILGLFYAVNPRLCLYSTGLI